MTLDFDLILESFLSFLVPNWLYFGVGVGLIIILGCTHVVEQLSFSMIP